MNVAPPLCPKDASPLVEQRGPGRGWLEMAGGLYCQTCDYQIPKWQTEVADLRQRLTSYMLSSGGSAMYDDDRDPRHLLFLVTCVLMENGWQVPEDK